MLSERTGDRQPDERDPLGDGSRIDGFLHLFKLAFAANARCAT
jgi:hypothetical protein